MGVIATPNQVRRRMKEYADRETPTEFPHNKRGPIIAELNEICETDENRYIVYGWLFTPDGEPMELLHSADLTPQQWNGLKRWQGAKNVAADDEKAVWESRQEFVFEVQCVLTRASYHWEVTQARRPMVVPIDALVKLPTEGEPETQKPVPEMKYIDPAQAQMFNTDETVAEVDRKPLIDDTPSKSLPSAEIEMVF